MTALAILAIGMLRVVIGSLVRREYLLSFLDPHTELPVRIGGREFMTFKSKRIALMQMSMFEKSMPQFTFVLEEVISEY